MGKGVYSYPDIGAIRALNIDAPPARKATGLLIPKLSPRIPRTIAKSADQDTTVLQKLVDHGVIKLTDKFTSEMNAIDEGFLRMMGPRFRAFEEAFSMTHIGGTADKIGVLVLPCASDYMRLELKPVFARIGMTTEAAAWAARVMNQHYCMSGPHRWEALVEDGIRASPEAEHKDGYVEWVEAKPEDIAKRASWWKEFYRSHPWLFGFRFEDDKLIDVFTRNLVSEKAKAIAAIRRKDKKLAEIMDELHLQMGKPEWYGDECYAVSYWEKGDIIDHTWDYITHQFHEGNIDHGSYNLIEYEGSIPECIAMFKRVEAWISPVEKLNDWISSCQK